MNTIKQQKFCGKNVTTEEVSLIQEIVSTCNDISRNELAYTVCELLDWRRPGGGLKATECRGFLELLESKGILILPQKRNEGYAAIHKSIAVNQPEESYSTLTGRVENFTPLEVNKVQTPEQRELFKTLLTKYHYLGYAMPFGARLQYLVYVSRPAREVVGCIQFSSPAWRMKARDQWIGWDDARRAVALQQVVNNSRFLVLAPIQNLASTMLSMAIRRLKSDWKRQYGITPLLLETLVDRKRFHGGCYRASNWIELGETSGRGRMDRRHQLKGSQIKTILVYPLIKNAVHRLRGGQQK